jgi:hypothetical protein
VSQVLGESRAKKQENKRENYRAFILFLSLRDLAAKQCGIDAVE